MLTAYLTATQNLLQNPAAPTPLYSTASLTTYVNTARGQLAGESGCIRSLALLPVTVGVSTYPFSSIELESAAGVLGVFNVRTVWLIVPAQAWLQPETFEEYSLYDIFSAAGSPKRWAQYGPGQQGSLVIAPSPDRGYTLQLDCACVPVTLADDTTPEAIPYLWTDAVPYFAAYLALLSAQTGARAAEADKMLQRYQLFVQRARDASTSQVLPWQQPQMPVPGGINPPPQRAQGAGG